MILSLPLVILRYNGLIYLLCLVFFCQRQSIGSFAFFCQRQSISDHPFRHRKSKIRSPLRLWRRTYPIPLRGKGVQVHRGKGGKKTILCFRQRKSKIRSPLCTEGARGTSMLTPFAKGDHPEGVRGTGDYQR